MKRILNWFGKAGGEPAPAPPALPRVTVEQIGDFQRHFPIGARVRYYPEYQKNILLDSVILAYALDGALVYANHALRSGRPGEGAGLVLDSPTGARRIAQVDRFHFVIPQTTRTELDYPNGAPAGGPERLAERPVNDFVRGNTITLFNKGDNGKVPHLETTVARITTLTEGYYANRRVALLQPEPETFTYLDQREFPRIYTAIPAALGESPDGEPHPCTIRDFSERFVRVDLATDDSLRADLAEGRRLFLTVPLPHQDRAFVLRATVHRLGEAETVLALTGILKARRFENLDLVDELDLKTSLLHHPATQPFCSTES